MKERRASNKLTMDRVVSFDVFDTCLVRACGTPNNLFDVLSKRVFKGDVDECWRQEFIVRRKDAENRAGQGHITPGIFDIYAEYDFFHPQLKDKESLARAEMDLEEELLRPVLWIKDLISKYRSTGYRILFISDMYLPSSTIKSVLTRYGMMVDGDGLFVSCEYGATKTDGSLFLAIRKMLGYSFKRWDHYGDNRIGDVSSPRSLGIKAHHISHAYSVYQKEWLRKEIPSGFKYGSIVAGISRSLRYSDIINDRTHFLLDIVAPLYCAFCGTVLLDAQKRGISRLYFCARDTYHMREVASAFTNAISGVEVKYLYISRSSLKDSSDEVLLRYFIQEGLASNDCYSAIVDCTSTGNSLSIINRILTAGGYNQVYGYYLIKYDGFSCPTYEDKYYASVRQKYAETSLVQGLLTHIPVFECMMSANTSKRTVGYINNADGGIVPVFSSQDDTEGIQQNGLEYWESYHSRVVKSYASLYESSGLLDYSKDVLNNISIPTLLAFFNIPEKEYLSAFNGITLNHKGGRTNIPYIYQGPILSAIISNRGTPFWWRGTIVNRLPGIIGNLYKKFALAPQYRIG